MPDVPHARAPWWAFVLVGLALAGFLAAAVVNFLNFRNEAQLREHPYTVGNDNLDDGVIIDARVLKVDPSVNEITYRLTYTPKGAYANPQEQLTRPVTIEVLSNTGTVTKRFAAGQEMRGQDITEAMYDGSQSDYPFDKYTAALSLAVFNPADEQVPAALDVRPESHGFSFVLRDNSRAADGYYQVAFQIKRSSATRIFAVFLMVIMWLLTATAFGLMVRVILLGRAIEFPMFTFLATLLFAFPAVRNTLPGAPPLGARFDYLSFFWCEMLVAFSLIVALGTWVVHRAAADPTATGSPAATEPGADPPPASEPA